MVAIKQTLQVARVAHVERNRKYLHRREDARLAVAVGDVAPDAAFVQTLALKQRRADFHQRFRQARPLGRLEVGTLVRQFSEVTPHRPVALPAIQDVEHGGCLGVHPAKAAQGGHALP